MADFRETMFEYIVGEQYGTFYSAERRMINKIHKLKEQYPNDVDIRVINDDGSVVVHLPVNWFRISPKRKRELNDEQKQAARDRLANARQNKNNKESEIT